MVLLRDLKPELQHEWVAEILKDPDLRRAYENGKDIQIGEYHEAKLPYQEK